MGLPTRHDTVTALGQVLRRFEEQRVGPGVDRDGCFGHHPLPLPEFLRGLEVIGDLRGRWLSLGCGYGTKLALLHYLGWPELVGVERDPVLAHCAEQLVPEALIHQCDAFTFDCSGFDVVYTYRLYQDLDRQEALGRHIAATAEPGALVFYAGADMPTGELVAESVWRV